MDKRTYRVIRLARDYARELASRGVSIDGIVLFGSHARGTHGPLSDIDFALFSEQFGPPRFADFSGKLGDAKRIVNPMIEDSCFRTSELDRVSPVSLLAEVAATGKLVYLSAKKNRLARQLAQVRRRLLRTWAKANDE